MQTGRTIFHGPGLRTPVRLRQPPALSLLAFLSGMR